jgi:hypothetical protein
VETISGPYRPQAVFQDPQRQTLPPPQSYCSAFAIALQLDLDEPWTCSDSWIHFIHEQQVRSYHQVLSGIGLYDFHKINQILFEYDQMLLGAKCRLAGDQ